MGDAGHGQDWAWTFDTVRNGLAHSLRVALQARPKWLLPVMENSGTVESAAAAKPGEGSATVRTNTLAKGDGVCRSGLGYATSTTVVQERGGLHRVEISRARYKKSLPIESGRSSIGGRGFTLLEILICLSLLALLSTFALSGVQHPGESSEPSRFTSSLSRLLITARSLAVASGERITLCGSNDGVSCSRDWHADIDILVFTDRDRDRRLGEADALHVQQRLLLRHASAHWRGSGGRPYLRYRVNGSAIEYGRFSYCPHSGDRRQYRQLVVNRVGRAYLQRESQSKNQACP